MSRITVSPTSLLVFPCPSTDWARSVFVPSWSLNSKFQIPCELAKISCFWPLSVSLTVVPGSAVPAIRISLLLVVPGIEFICGGDIKLVCEVLFVSLTINEVRLVTAVVPNLVIKKIMPSVSTK